MIFVHSIISGYISLQGSFTYHIPMFIAMLVFIKVPEQEELALAFPGEEETCRIWYICAACMHLLLSVIHMIQVFSLEEYFLSSFMSIQLVSVLLEIWNLCKMLSLYGISIIQGTVFSESCIMFQFWIVIEAVAIFGTLGATIIYLFWRAMFRDSITIEFDQSQQKIDTTQDYMSA